MWQAGSSNSKSLEEIGRSFAIWITEIMEGGRFERHVTMLSNKQDRENGNRIPVKTASNFPIEVKLHSTSADNSDMLSKLKSAKQ